MGPGPDHRTTHSVIREMLGKSGNALLRTVTPDQEPAPCGIRVLATDPGACLEPELETQISASRISGRDSSYDDS